MTGLAFPIIYNFGTNIFLGQISYITEALATVLQLGVTMDYSIFLLSRYQEEQNWCKDDFEAMEHAIRNTATSISASSLTTIAGFVALCIMRLTLGRDIGIVMAKGVVLGLISTVTILPSLLLCFRRQINKHTHKTLIPKLEKTSYFIPKHYKAILAVFLCVFAVFGLAYPKVEQYYTLTDSLPDDMTGKVGTEKLKEDFHMASSIFVIVDENLSAEKIQKMDAEIKNMDGITSVEVANIDFQNVNWLSVVLVFLIIAISFKSLSIPVLLVASIESAIIMNMAIPYFSGTVIPFIASIVIGTIQLGATVDYAILMTTRFKEELNRGHSRKEAAQIAIENCSRSIMTSGLTFFAATIGVSFISKMELLTSICIMIARGALISMVVIIFVLPGLLI